jgi:hypothetical protein
MYDSSEGVAAKRLMPLLTRNGQGHGITCPSIIIPKPENTGAYQIGRMRLPANNCVLGFPADVRDPCQVIKKPDI